MQRIVKGVFCDTEKGTLVDSIKIRHSECLIHDWIRKSLYRMPEGQYFIYHEIGFAEQVIASNICETLGTDAAKKMLERMTVLKENQLCTVAADYTERSETGCSMYTYMVSDAVFTRLCNESEQRNKTLSQLVGSVLMKHFNLK